MSHYGSFPQILPSGVRARFLPPNTSPPPVPVVTAAASSSSFECAKQTLPLAVMVAYPIDMSEESLFVYGN